MISALVGAWLALASLAPMWAPSASMQAMAMPMDTSMHAPAANTSHVASHVASRVSPHAADTAADHAPCDDDGSQHGCCPCCPCCPCCNGVSVALDAGRVIALDVEPPLTVVAVTARHVPAIRPARLDSIQPFANGPPVDLHA